MCILIPRITYCEKLHNTETWWLHKVTALRKFYNILDIPAQKHTTQNIGNLNSIIYCKFSSHSFQTNVLYVLWNVFGDNSIKTVVELCFGELQCKKWLQYVCPSIFTLIAHTTRFAVQCQNRLKITCHWKLFFLFITKFVFTTDATHKTWIQALIYIDT